MTEYKWNKYKKKPVVIQAKRMKKSFFCKTLEGIMKGEKGDWLVIGVQGEPYPCKDSVFKKTYELVKK